MMNAISDQPPRDRIIHAALNLFFSEGFCAVGMNQICETARVNKSSLYHIFPSKIELVLATLQVYSDDISRKFSSIAKSSDPPLKKLERVFETPFEANVLFKDSIGSVKGCFVGNVVLELAGCEKRIQTYLAYIFQCWAEAIAPIVQEIATVKTIDSVAVASSVVAYLQGAILVAKAQNDPYVIKRFSQSAASLIP
jgi:TetR/AcrR family transcriptional regulator, transcriptional repressor for nem operon